MVERMTRNVCIFCRYFKSPRRPYSSESRSREITTEKQHVKIPPQLSRLVQHQTNLENPVTLVRHILQPLVPSPQNSTQFDRPRSSLALREAVHQELNARNAQSHAGQSTHPSSSDPPLAFGLPPMSQHEVATVGAKVVRKLIRAQLNQVRQPRDLLRILATAMQRPALAQQFSYLGLEVVRAMFRLRQTNSDSKILVLLNIVIARLEKPIQVNRRTLHLHVHPLIVKNALLFAARSRSLQAMKRHLLRLRTMGIEMDARLFQAIVAKFSVGYRGHGEIRNGRWMRDDLLQVLLGFRGEMDEDLPEHHLGSFVVREDWRYLYVWILILARCKAKDELWREWELWHGSEQRKKGAPESHASSLAPRSESEDKYHPDSLLQSSWSQDGDRQNLYHFEIEYWKFCKGTSPKLRGDLWFIHQFILASAHEQAWKALEQSDLVFSELPRYIQIRMMEHVEFATKRSPDMEGPLLAMYEQKLEKLERTLGLSWVPLDATGGAVPQGQRASSGDQESGYHVLTLPAEEMLEHLQEPPSEKRERGFFSDGIEDEVEIDDDLAIGKETPPPYHNDTF